RCWYLPMEEAAYRQLIKLAKDKAVVHSEALKTYLADRKHDLEQGLRHKKIRSINEHIIPRMEQYLKLKAYSPSTIRTYLNEMAQLLVWAGDTAADTLSTDDLKRYLVYCYDELH